MNTKLPFELNGIDQQSLLYAIGFFLKEVECDEYQIIRPGYVLHRLTENSKYVCCILSIDCMFYRSLIVAFISHMYIL